MVRRGIPIIPFVEWSCIIMKTVSLIMRSVLGPKGGSTYIVGNLVLINLEGEDPDFPIEGEILARGPKIYKWTREGKIFPKGLLPEEDDLMIFTSFDL